MSLTFELGIIVLLVLFNGFLAMSELAVVSSRRARLAAMAEAGSGGARRAMALAENQGRFLSTVQIGITLVGVLAGAFSGATVAGRFDRWLEAEVPALAPYAEELALAVVVGAITYLSLIVGELVPKRIALAHPERMAALAAGPMRLVSAVAAPFVWVLDRSSHLILRLLRIEATETAMSEDEIRAAIGESTAAGVLAPEENEMMRAVMRFADRKVRTIMTPRREIDWLDLNEAHDVIVSRLRATKHSRYPVCRDAIDDLVGIVVAKDILDIVLSGRDFNLSALVRPAEVVPDSAGALSVLERLKRAPVHLAVVVDEYGAVQGVVTPSDILAELVGGMAEHGENWVPQAVRRDDGSWLIDGDMDAARAGEVIGFRGLGENASYATLAGFILTEFRTLPRAGQAFDRGGFRFEVVDMDGRRIDKVLVVPPSATEDRA
ncbi:Hemolysin [Caenispirillum salinarum AK4]|uniref:Hemolysin n=1 Tax=Caenispirillum salinarum AK4 TaxID=1238182 RepID=K9HNC9_9PROT|nr:hemolysin family protein [Caenispirillum salinarum]EKV31838.1 Hemolysin [Caenispirillum salinarum AK4]